MENNISNANETQRFWAKVEIVRSSDVAVILFWIIILQNYE